MADLDLSGQVALISGASRGIGRAIALAYAEAGAQVVLASRKLEGLERVADEIRAAGGQARAIACHVGDEAAIGNLVEETLQTFERVDILVNNAATNLNFGPLLSASAAQWDKTLEVNLRGPFLLCREVAPHMQRQGGGRILNVASVAGLRHSPLLGAYSVSKAGLIMLTRVLAQELGPEGITVNALAPGVIRTEFSRPLWETGVIGEAVLQGTPLGRFGEVEDVAGAALYLASPAAAFITGSVIVMDGGMSVVGLIG